MEHYFSSVEAQIVLGDIYFKCRNFGKAVSYYHTAFETTVSSRGSHQDIVKVFSKLFECTHHSYQKKNFHRQLVEYCS